MRWLVILLIVTPLWAQPELRTEVRGGVVRAVLLHVDTGRPVADEEPARPNERLTGYLRSAGAGTMMLVDAEEVPVFVERPVIQIRTSPRSRSRSRLAAADSAVLPTVQEAPWQQFEFTVPTSVGGSFVEVFLSDEHGRTGTATFPVAQEAEDSSQLTDDDVYFLISRAALAVDDNRMAIAAVDRAGRPLGVFRKPQATDDDVETALSLARTSAFFSHDMAPLSSRTVQTISRENFPNNVPNQPAALRY